MKTSQKLRIAKNAFRLLLRRDARSVRRCKYWLRQYGVRDLTSAQLRRPQAPFDLCCLATGVDINRWLDMGSSEPATLHLGGGVLVKDTPERLEMLGLLDD
jgi:hypothetical protein